MKLVKESESENDARIQRCESEIVVNSGIVRSDNEVFFTAKASISRFHCEVTAT